MKRDELGFFGNIWVRQHTFEKAGEVLDGHEHHFDHVSFLTHGKAKVEVEGYPTKEFEAPTFIVIRKDHCHKVTALEDKTNWYCVFALRDLDGVPVEIYEGKHDPLSAAGKN